MPTTTPPPNQPSPRPDLTVRARGSGRPIVLVHGTAPPVWGELADRLAAGATVIDYDRRGWCGTPGEARSLSDHARDLAELLGRLPAPAVVVGWSIGGVIALETAALTPERVHALVLLEPPLHAKRHPTFAMFRGVVGGILLGKLGAAKVGARAFYRWAFRRRSGEHDFLRHPHLAEASMAQARAVTRELALGTGEHLGPDDLARVRCPVVLLTGDESVAAFEAATNRIAAALPQARVTRVERSGHALQLDRPDAVASAALAMIA